MTGPTADTAQADTAQADTALLDAGRADAEVAVALGDLARLVNAGVPGCDGASISLLRDGEPSTLAASHEVVRRLDEAQYSRGAGPCVTAMHEQRKVTVDDYRADGRWPDVAADIETAGMRASLSLPLSEGGQVLGGLNLYACTQGAFTEPSRDAAESFARQAVVMLGYLRQLHAERAAHARERAMSLALQRSLLPTLPELAGISSAGRYRAGARHAQVGGDWYDLFGLPDGAIGIAIGDVMGHDIAAAAAMGQLQSVLRSYAYEGSSPSVVLDRLDRLVQDFDMAQLATVVYARLVLDDGPAGRSGMLLFTNAGHPPPLVRLPDGTVSRLRRGAAPLIGVLPPGQARRGEGALVLPAGSLLLLYTDGLVETRDRDIDHSVDALATALAALPADLSPEATCDALLSAMARPGHDDDDVALLAVRIDDPAPAG